MDLFRTIISIVSKINGCCGEAMGMSPVFDGSEGDWKLIWSKRNAVMDRIKKLDQDLRPHYAIWQEAKSGYSLDIQKKVNQNMNELVLSLKKLHDENRLLHSKIREASNSIKKNLSYIKSSPKAIACYASH